jgi:RNA polymerase sigma factor (sigma-70 family)
MDNKRRERLIKKYIRRWRPLIKKLAGIYKTTIADYEDLCAVGYMQIVVCVDRYEPDRGSIEAFICTCLHNAIRSASINSSYTIHIPSGSIHYVDEDSKFNGQRYEVDELYIDDSRENVIDIMDIITRNDKDDIAHMYFIDGLTYADIVQETGWSVATISRHITTIKDKVRNYVES